MRLISVLTVLALSPTGLFAAFNHPTTSPTQAACGETLANRDVAAGFVLQNPAAACLAEGTQVEFAGQRLYSLSELDSYLASGAFSYHKWGLGVAFLSMGESDFYLETSFSGHIGYRIANSISVGVSLSHNRVSMGERYGHVSTYSSTIGGIVAPSQDWTAYLSVRNPTEPSTIGESRMRRELNAGVAVHKFKDFNFAVGVDSRSGDDLRYKIGETYRLSRSLSISAGIMTSPFVPSFGCIISWSTLGLLYAYRYHSDLGGTHIWGITISM